MSELRGQPEESRRDVDRSRPEPSGELREDDLRPYDPLEHLARREDQPRAGAGLVGAEHSKLTALRDRIRQTIADRFGGGTAARTPDADAPREVHDLEDPAVTSDYRRNLPACRYDRYLVRDGQTPIPLFDGPPSRGDVRQGGVGDCGVIAALAAVAGHRPEAIRNAIRQVDDGTYEVTLHEVRPALPLDPVARPTGDTVAYRLTDELPVRLDRPSEPLLGATPVTSSWAPLLEKALAAEDQGWSTERQAECEAFWRLDGKPFVDRERMTGGLSEAPKDAPTGYDRLNVGSTDCMQADLLAELTGDVAEVRQIPDGPRAEDRLLDDFRRRLEDGMPILVNSRHRRGNEPAPGPFLAFGHAYEVTAVVDDKIQLRNPWGDDAAPDPIDVTTFMEYYRNIERDGSRSGTYVTLR